MEQLRLLPLNPLPSSGGAPSLALALLAANRRSRAADVGGRVFDLEGHDYEEGSVRAKDIALQFATDELTWGGKPEAP